MNITTTPMGLNVSDIKSQIRQEEILSTEFYFLVTSPMGLQRIFYYQIDARGVAGWHMYAMGTGDEAPATKPISREHMGKLELNFVLADIDKLWCMADEIPNTTHYLLLPGHRDAVNKPDFIIIPLTQFTIAFFRTFESISKHYIEDVKNNNIINSMQHVLQNAREFFLPVELKKEFLNEPYSELGIINTKLINKGHYLFPADLTPSYIQNAVNMGMNTRPLFLELRKGQKNGVILDTGNNPIGILYDFKHVFKGYELAVNDNQRMQAFANKEIPLYKEKDTQVDLIGEIMQKQKQ